MRIISLDFSKTALFVTFKFWASSRYARWSLIYELSKRINAVMFKRCRSQLWHLNRHVHAYVEMDELAKIDYNADRLEIDVEKGNSLDHYRIARIKRKVLLIVGVLKPVVYVWMMVSQSIQ